MTLGQTPAVDKHKKKRKRRSVQTDDGSVRRDSEEDMEVGGWCSAGGQGASDDLAAAGGC